MELTQEKSEEVAEVLTFIRLQILTLDLDYLKEAARQFQNQAGKQEGLSVLLPSHPQSKNDLLRMQGRALTKLIEYIETLKEIDALKLQVIKDEVQRSDIAKLFV